LPNIQNTSLIQNQLPQRRRILAFLVRLKFIKKQLKNKKHVRT
jgi:hypothetical protein